jgi:CubicO group peptidase (beta-lactamase class C family)
MQGLLQHLISKKNVKHAIVAVQSNEGRFRWFGAAGDANPDGTPMRVDTPFHIASVDKLLTASVVMMLHERGRVDLDESIAAYLPQTLIGGIHRLGGIDHTETITVRHLLGHTSGLADCLEDRPRGGKSLMERLFHEGDRAWTIDDLLHIVRDQLTPHFPPQPMDLKRQKVRYSDTNYQLLIAIIESLTTQPLHQVFEELLFRPLDLRCTYLFGYSEPPGHKPDPATIWFEDQPLNLPLALRAFPSVYSTAEDCLTFLRALVRGEIFDQPVTLALMQNRWNRFSFALDPVALRSPGWPIEYSLGMMRFRLPRVFTPLRPVPAVIGHTGSSGSWLFHCPELDLLLCGTVDQATAGAVPYRFVPRLLRTIDSVTR